MTSRTRSVVAALLAGLATWGLVSAHGAADRVLEPLGVSRLASLGGAVVHVRGDAGALDEASAIIAARVVKLGWEPTCVSEPDGRRVEVPDGTVGLISAVLEQSGRLELRPVVAHSELFASLRQLSADLEPFTGGLRGVGTIDVRAAIADAMARCEGCRLRARERIDYGLVTWASEEGPLTVAYVTTGSGALDERIIARARVTYDDQNRPAVLLELTEQGSDAFFALTSELVGQQLAIITDGEVRSAPTVMSGIRDQVQINLGAAGVAGAEEATALAATFGQTGKVPPGIEVSVEAVTATATTALAVTRVALGVLAALLVFGLGRALAKTSLTYAPLRVPQADARSPGPLVWRVLVTLVCGALPIILRWVPLPGADGIDTTDSRPAFSLATLTLAPVIVGYFLVELFALGAPDLRARRHGGARARAPFLIATMIIAASLYVLQIIGLLRGFRAMERFDAIELGVPLVIIGLALGPLLQLGAARLISRQGLGPGLAIVYLADQLFTLGNVDVADTPTPALVAVIALALCLAGATALLQRTTSGAHRLPLGGALALQIGAIALVAYTLLADAFPRLIDVWSALSLPVRLAVTLSAGVLFALATTRPSAPRQLVSVGGLFHGGEHAAARGLASSPQAGSALWPPRRRPSGVLLPVALTLLWLAASMLLASPLEPLGGAAVAILTSLALDLVHEAKARLAYPDLVAVWPFHDSARAEHAADELRARGLVVAFRGFHMQALLRLFGAWVPAQILVPAGQVAAAQQALTNEPARPVVDAALAAL